MEDQPYSASSKTFDPNFLQKYVGAKSYKYFNYSFFISFKIIENDKKWLKITMQVA